MFDRNGMLLIRITNVIRLSYTTQVGISVYKYADVSELDILKNGSVGFKMKRPNGSAWY